MVNTAKLRGRIVEKGKTIQSIAPKIPCSPYILGRKINNEAPFNLEEVMIVCDELEIMEYEFADFFLQKSCKIQRNKLKKNS